MFIASAPFISAAKTIVKGATKAFRKPIKHRAKRNLFNPTPLFSTSLKSETNFLLNTPLGTAEIVRRILIFGSVDYIFVEGADEEIQLLEALSEDISFKKDYTNTDAGL
jgi:hypothetical protein